MSRLYLQRLIVVTTPLLLLIAAATQSDGDPNFIPHSTFGADFMILIGHATARKSHEQFAAMAQLSGDFWTGYGEQQHYSDYKR